jgi:hypothetical protein
MGTRTRKRQVNPACEYIYYSSGKADVEPQNPQRDTATKTSTPKEIIQEVADLRARLKVCTRLGRISGRRASALTTEVHFSRQQAASRMQSMRRVYVPVNYASLDSEVVVG